MNIRFERSGGITGMRITADIDTADLSADDVKVIQKLVEDADFFNLPTKIESAYGAEQFQYLIRIEADDQQHTVEASEGALPESLRPLVRKLTVLARSAKT
jgi:hypothetical protein